jgi:hypothetical protein
MVYVVAVPFVAVLTVFISMVAGWDDLGNSWYGAHAVLERERADRFTLVEFGYVPCICALVIGAFCTRETRTRRSLLILVAVALVLMLLLYPATLAVKTR